jgi:putative ABC transport system substrate-binding protein
VSGLSRRQLLLDAGLAGLGLLVSCGQRPGLGQPAAQASTRVHRIGWLSFGSPQPSEAFLEELRTLGREPGRDVIIESRSSMDDWPVAVAELVRLPVDVLVTQDTAPTVAAQRATNTIPIVMLTADPVGAGLAASLARPGGNVTGVSLLNRGLTGKRLELLVQAFPTLSQVAGLSDSTNPTSLQSQADMRAAAEALGVRVHPVDVPLPADPVPAMEAARQAGAEALIVATGTLRPLERSRLLEFTSAHRWPAIYPTSTYVPEGGLMSYAASRAEQQRRLARYVDRILRGAKPAELPIEQPTTFDFVINLKTAHALGLTIPQHVLLQATELIQ